MPLVYMTMLWFEKVWIDTLWLLFPQIGLIGLVEYEWIDTLASLDPEDVSYEDYVERGTELARSLKEQVDTCILILS